MDADATATRGRRGWSLLLPRILLIASIPALSTLPLHAAGAPQGSQPTAEARSYCENIANAAADARFAWETEKLTDLETRIKTRIGELDAKQAQLRAWIAKRDDIEKRANEKLVGIYSKMRPETAATQISTLDDEMAAAVLSQLNPRQASAIFNEIVPERAAKLAGLIAGSAASSDDKKL